MSERPGAPADGSAPAVSVVIPTYNRAERVGRAIDSVLHQRFAEFEVLVVDDGSTDDTAAVLEGYDDERVRYVRQENAGANAARNRGIEESEGEFVSFLDSDDELHPEHLEAVVEALREEPPECAGVATAYRKCRDGEAVDVIEAHEGRITSEEIADANVVGGFSCTTFRRAVFDDVGLLNAELASSQDYEFFLRALTAGYYMVGIDRALVDYHVHGEQITTDVERRIEGQEYLLAEYGDVITDKRRAQQRYMRGRLYADRGETSKAAREFREAIALDPTYYLYYHQYLGALSGKRGYDLVEGARKRIKFLLRRLG
ncbi:MAG: glycosyltransferase family A protein [Halalkalicoccus sp.]